MNEKDNFASLGLDRRDRQIMYALDENARQSNASIAKKLKLGKNVANYRINRLLKNGVMRGFYTVIDAHKLGYIALRVYVKWKFIMPEE